MNDRQNDQIVEREEHLDNIHQGAQDLQIMAKNIGDQVKSNMQIVEDTNEAVEGHKKKMGGVMGKLSDLQRTSDNKQLYTVLVLFGVIMFEIFLLLI